MIDREPLPVRGLLLTLLLVGFWGGVAYVLFVGAICVWVGVGHAHHSGYGVPILAGALTIGGALRLALPVDRALRGAIRGKAGDPDLEVY